MSLFTPGVGSTTNHEPSFQISPGVGEGPSAVHELDSGSYLSNSLLVPPLSKKTQPWPPYGAKAMEEPYLTTDIDITLLQPLILLMVILPEASRVVTLC